MFIVATQFKTLEWYLTDLRARRTAVLKTLKNPRLTEVERATWAERLAEVEMDLTDIESDPLGYVTWVLAEWNMAVRKQTDRFMQ